MKFDDLDARMRVYETLNDPVVLPGIWMVARIDGRGFTRLTKEVHAFESPFDVRVRDLMVDTVAHLMDCGFEVRFGYTQSDEISLLFARDTGVFGRKVRKYVSILAGEASARFTRGLGGHAAFDCRICQLPREQDVVDYFRWRSEDAHRNALGAHAYWALRRDGQSQAAATRALEGLTVAQKNELLWQHGINFNDLPAWQKRGVGLYWGTVQRAAVDPRTGEGVTAERRELIRDLELPMKDAYSAFIERLVSPGSGPA